MTKVISALTARTQFGQIMERASTNQERFIVDRRGEPSVVIISVEDYIENFAPAPDFLEKIWEASERRGLNEIPMAEIDTEIAAYRSQKKTKPTAKRNGK
jgi:prevent-host-death family protein